jgi:hypothetical protein
LSSWAWCCQLCLNVSQFAMKDVDHRNQRLIGPKIYMTWIFCSVQILRLVFERVLIV